MGVVVEFDDVLLFSVDIMGFIVELVVLIIFGCDTVGSDLTTNPVLRNEKEISIMVISKILPSILIIQ